MHVLDNSISEFEIASMARISPLQRKAETHQLEGDETYAVQGLARELLALRVFQPGKSALGNAEIAARTGLPRSTASRLTETPTALGRCSRFPHGPQPAYVAGAR